MEVRCVRETSFSNFGEEVDHLQELNEFLEKAELDASGEDDEMTAGPFELCPSCYESLLRNPVGREPGLAFGFSNN